MRGARSVPGRPRADVSVAGLEQLADGDGGVDEADVRVGLCDVAEFGVAGGGERARSVAAQAVHHQTLDEHHPAHHVVLRLHAGGVADGHRADAGEARQMRELWRGRASAAQRPVLPKPPRDGPSAVVASTKVTRGAASTMPWAMRSPAATCTGASVMFSTWIFTSSVGPQ